jgi:hypothetical protein
MQLNRVNAITELTKVIGMVLIKETRSGGVTNFDLPRKENFNRFIPTNEDFDDTDLGSPKLNKGKFIGSIRP